MVSEFAGNFTPLKLTFCCTVHVSAFKMYHLCAFRWKLFTSISTSYLALARDITAKMCSSNQLLVSGMQYALAPVTINCIGLRQKPKIYPISRLLQQNIHLSEVNLILGLLPSLELPCCYAATSSCAVYPNAGYYCACDL